MKKLGKSAKNLDIMAATVFWVCAVFSGLLAVAIGIALFIPSKFYRNIVTNVIFDFVKLEIAAEYMPDINDAKIYFICGFAMALVALVLVCGAIRILRKILKPMKDGLPFDGTVSVNLMKLFYFSLIGGGLFSVVTLIHEILASKVFDFANLFASEKIASITLEYTLDLNFLYVSAMLFVLSLIFRYGEMLQKESDETL